MYYYALCMHLEKTERQRAIIELLDAEVVSSQEALREKLGEAGFDVTQATLSRDLRELGFVKVVAPGGEYQYVRAEPGEGETIISITVSRNLLVIKTKPGMAPPIAYRIDDLGWAEILGTVAGENTLFVVLSEDCDPSQIKESVRLRLKG